MARTTYPGDWVLRRDAAGGLVTAPGGTVEVWTAETGGTRLTDLQVAAAAAVALPVDATGWRPTFTGPDGVTGVLWLDAPGAVRRSPVAPLEGRAGPAGPPGADSTIPGPKGDNGTATAATLVAGPGSSLVITAAKLGTETVYVLDQALTLSADTTGMPATAADDHVITLKQPATGGPFAVTYAPSIVFGEGASGPSMPQTPGGELVLNVHWNGQALRAAMVDRYP